MKKAIVFLMVLGVFTFNVFTAEVANTQVKFEFTSGGLTEQNFAFVTSATAVTDMTTAKTVQNVSSIPIEATSDDFTENSTFTENFNFIWYYYSTEALNVTLKVGAMQNSGKTEELSWTITPSSAFGNTNNTASYSEITAPDVGDTTKDVEIVKVTAPNVMTQNWGNIQLAGVVDITGATPGTYTSKITAEISSN